MSLETEFYLKLLATFIAAGLLYKYMSILEKRKQDAADRKFEETMQMIELRNRRIDDNLQSDSKKD